MKKWKIISMLFTVAIMLLLGGTVMAYYDVQDGFSYEIANGEACIYILPNTEVVNIPQQIGDCPVTAIGYDFYLDAHNAVKKITVPDSVKVLDNYAFINYPNVEKINIGANVTTIGMACFLDCEKLQEVNIPSKVTSIGVSAFENCSSLKSISLPDGLETLGNAAFNGCSSIKSITVPSKIQTLPDYVFAECSSLETVTFSQGLTEIGRYAFQDCTALKEIALPEGLTSIKDTAFSYCSLESVTLPSTLHTIPQRAFYNCTNLQNINLDYIWKIESYGFGSCTSLQQVSIPSCLESIDNLAFNRCTSLKSFSVAQNNPAYCGLDGAVYDVNMTALKFFPAGKSGTYTIPASVQTIDKDVYSCFSNLDSFATETDTNFQSINGLLCNSAGDTLVACPGNTSNLQIPDGITVIGESALSSCSQITAVTLPKTMQDTPVGLFDKCSGLVNIYVHSDNPSYSAVDGLLCNKEQDTLIAVPKGRSGTLQIPEGVKTIENNALNNCKLITEVHLPQELKKIGNQAFMNCSGLTEIVIPGTVESIGNEAFSRCTSLQNATLKSGIKTIGAYCFSQCTALKTVVLNEGLTTIGEGAFERCSALETMAFPSSLKTLGYDVFYRATGIYSVFFKGDAPAIEDSSSLPPNILTVYTCPGAKGFNGSDSIFRYIEVVPVDEAIELTGVEASYQNGVYSGTVNITEYNVDPLTGTTLMVAVYKDGKIVGATQVQPYLPGKEPYTDSLVINVPFRLQALEEGDCIKCFLWTDADTIKPLVPTLEKNI